MESSEVHGIGKTRVRNYKLSRFTTKIRVLAPSIDLPPTLPISTDPIHRLSRSRSLTAIGASGTSLDPSVDS